MSKKIEKRAQASWGGRFKEKTSNLMLSFGESVSFDKALAPFDIKGSLAHAKMLAKCKIITNAEFKAIECGLKEVSAKIEAGEFEWDEALEDVHMNIEQALTKIAPEAAKLHTARSRNDQVATDMRLFFKYACEEVLIRLQTLLETLVLLAGENQKIYIPGYTHLQRAQPVSAAHHILAWAEMFDRDAERISFVAEGANVSPLGSGAIAGTTLPIDRLYAAAELGFTDEKGNPRVTLNSMDAVADRDSFLEFASACAIIGVHLSRVAEDVILWNSAEFSFASLPDAFTTGSSLMPQKKNPDSFELLRGKSARLIGNMNTLFTLLKGLPLTYNRDLQEDKPPVFDTFKQVCICLEVAAESLKGLKFRAQNCARAVSDPLLLATDLADYFVKKGVPFRNAHHMVGSLVALAEDSKTPINELADEDVFKVCPLAGKDWREVFSLKRAFESRENLGMPGPRAIAKNIALWKKHLS